ncbi:MAG: hypothetical protein Q9191_003241 [Dirinaria sp. TL-2023a]
MTWDSTTNERLLLAILQVHGVKVDFAAVAEIMGPQCTKRAVQEQLKKLKKLAPADQSMDATPGASQSKATKATGGSTTKAGSAKTTKVTPKSTAKEKPAKAAKAPAAKKQRTTKGANKGGKAPAKSLAGNDSDDGNLCDDEAGPGTLGASSPLLPKAKLFPNLPSGLSGTKRKAEDMEGDAQESNVGMKSEGSEAEDYPDYPDSVSFIEPHGNTTDEGPSSEELWRELTFGMGENI